MVSQMGFQEKFNMKNLLTNFALITIHGISFHMGLILRQLFESFEAHNAAKWVLFFVDFDMFSHNAEISEVFSAYETF